MPKINIDLTTEQHDLLSSCLQSAYDDAESDEDAAEIKQLAEELKVEIIG